MAKLSIEELIKKVNEMNFYVGTASFDKRIAFVFKQVQDLAATNKELSEELHSVLRTYAFENESANREKSAGSAKVISDFAVSRNREEYVEKVVFDDNRISDVISSVQLCKKFIEIFDVNAIKQGVISKALNMYKESVEYGYLHSAAQEQAEAFISSLVDHNICSEVEIMDAIITFRTMCGLQIDQGPYGLDPRVSHEVKSAHFKGTVAMQEKQNIQNSQRNEVVTKFQMLDKFYKAVLDKLTVMVDTSSYKQFVELINLVIAKDTVQLTNVDIATVENYLDDSVRFLGRTTTLANYKTRFMEFAADYDIEGMRNIVVETKNYVTDIINFSANIVNRNYVDGR